MDGQNVLIALAHLGLLMVMKSPMYHLVKLKDLGMGLAPRRENRIIVVLP